MKNLKKEPTQMPTPKGSKLMDADTEAMIFEGASLIQLARIYGIDAKDVKRKLHGVAPVKMRGGFPIYSIAEASAYLATPVMTPEEWIAKMGVGDLPVFVRKEFWAGLRSKQLFEFAAGDLWQTDKVIEHISEILKIFTMSLKLLSDNVSREHQLTVKQRDMIDRLVDETLAQTRARIEELCIQETEENAISNATIADDSGDDDEL